MTTDQHSVDEQLTAQQEYEYVESRWSDYRAMTYGRLDICDMEGEMDYHAAFLFTKQREREIAEVEEEIAWLNQMKRNLPPGRPTKEERQAILQRILAVEQARLAELRRGMKEGSE